MLDECPYWWLSFLLLWSWFVLDVLWLNKEANTWFESYWIAGVIIVMESTTDDMGVDSCIVLAFHLSTVVIYSIFIQTHINNYNQNESSSKDKIISSLINNSLKNRIKVQNKSQWSKKSQPGIAGKRKEDESVTSFIKVIIVYTWLAWYWWL